MKTIGFYIVSLVGKVIVEFKDHIGTFSYKIAGPSSGELFASERSAEFVRSGKWNSNDEIDTEQTLVLIDVMDSVYGEHSVVFSDGEIIDKVSGEYDEYFNDDYFELRWEDVHHYSYIYFLYSHNGTVTITWSIYANVMLGFEPDIAVNMAVNKLGLKKDDIKRVSYVDISDLLTTDKDRELLSLKGYIVKFAFNNEEVLQKTGTQSIAMIVIFDGYSYESCYNDEAVSSTTADAIYLKRSSRDFDLDKIQYEPVEGDFVKYEPVKQEKDSESSKQTEKKNKQDNTSSQVNNKCLVCGKTATHSMTGIASGELEWYCDEHWKFIQDTINNMEKDVGEGTASKHQCQAPGCSKEGTNQIIGISGEYEYYCTEHYQEMVDLYNKMLNGSN